MVTRSTPRHVCLSVFAAASLFYAMPAAASPTAPPANVELSIGLEAMHAQPLRPASDIVGIPRHFSFVATYLPPANIQVGGFLTMTDNLTVRDRAASLGDASRVALPVIPEVNASAIVAGAALAGAAAALPPPLVARAQGGGVRLAPMGWPVGVVVDTTTA